MSKVRGAISAIGGYVPDFVLTNALLETMVDTTDEWITSRTGIKERRIQKGKGLGSSDMAVAAIRNMQEKHPFDIDDIELIICATVTPDMVFPATANIIADKLGAKNAYGFDIEAACSGLLYALHTACRLIESGAHKKIIVVGVDKMSSIIDYTDRTTCVIFGDGAGAFLVEPNSDGYGMMDAILRSNGAGRVHLHQKAGGSVKPASLETVDAREHYVYQEGQPVFKMAVTHMADTAAEIMERNNLLADDVAWLVPHQANKRIISATASRMGLSEDKVMVNIEKYGNTTGGTLPLCLWDWEQRLKKGDNIILATFGGGFTWGALWLKWAYNG